MSISISEASVFLKDTLYPIILYSTGSCSGAFLITVTLFPAIKPISMILRRNAPRPLTFTINAVSPCFRSERVDII